MEFIDNALLLGYRFIIFLGDVYTFPNPHTGKRIPPATDKRESILKSTVSSRSTEEDRDTRYLVSSYSSATQHPHVLSPTTGHHASHRGPSSRESVVCHREAVWPVLFRDATLIEQGPLSRPSIYLESCEET